MLWRRVVTTEAQRLDPVFWTDSDTCIRVLRSGHCPTPHSTLHLSIKLRRAAAKGLRLLFHSCLCPCNGGYV